MDKIPYVNTIAVPLTSANNNQIVCLVDNNPVSAASKFEITGKCTVNCYIDELIAFASLSSLQDAPFPQFEVTDSQAEQTIKALDVAWKSPRRHLNLWLSKNGMPWISIGIVSAQNPGGYKYTHYRLLDQVTNALAGKLGEYSRLGISVEEAGSGLLQSGEILNIYGAFTQEVIYKENPMISYPPTALTLPTASSSTPGTLAVTATSQEVFPAASNRLGYAIKNTGANTVYLEFDAAATSASIISVPSGATYYNEPYMQTRQVRAICAAGQTSTLNWVIWS